jgi:hypothetical protein
VFFVKVKHLFVILVVISNLIIGQNNNLYYYQITTDQGLPSNTIYSILQSKKGHLYIGHEFGISRYNGNSFYNYKHHGKGKSLHNIIESNDNILATSFYGDLININGDSIYSHPYSEKEKSSIPIIRKSGKKIFILEKNKLFQFKNNKLKKINFVKENSPIWIYDISEKNNGDFIIAVINNNKCELITLDYNFIIKKTEILPCENVKKLQFLRIKEKLYLYSFGTNQLYEINDGPPTLSKIQLQFNYNGTKWINIFNIDENTIGICGYDGLLLFDTKGQISNHLIKGSQVSDVLKDIEGNLIVSTLNEGLYIFPSHKIFSYPLEDLLEKKDFIHKAIQLNDSILLIGTTHGKLIKYNINNNTTRSFQFEKRAEIQTITYDKENKKIAVFCDALYILNENDLKIEQKITLTSTKDILIHQKIIYCATSGHFIIIENNKQTILFDNTWINNLSYDSTNNKIWLGTNKGLMYYDLKLKVGAKKTIGLTSQVNTNIKTVKNDGGGNLYFLISNLGIVKKDRSDKFTVIVKNEDIENFSLKKDTIIAIFKNEVHFYDLNSGKLIYKLNETKGMDKLIVDFIQTNDYCGTIHPKFIKIFRSLLGANTIKPKIFLSKLKGTYSLSTKHVFKSDYNKNNLEFKIEILPNIRSRNNFTIKYRLVNVDEDWVETTSDISETSFKYQQLNSGKYTFEAVAINEDNIESEKFILHFEISPPFWQKWWFITLIILFTATILALLYIWRIRFLNKKSLLKITMQRNKIRLLMAELTAIRSQMNPHFIFNILSSIQSKVLNEKPKEAYNDISTFSKLIRSVLDYSSKEFIKLNYEIEFIKNYLQLESSRFDGKMNYELIVDQNIDIHFTEIPTLITLPFIENAIKHGLLHKEGDKNLKITFSGNNEAIEISIADNGVGRERSALINKQSQKGHRSFATDAMKKRIERINQSEKMKVDLEIIDHAVGVEVKIKLTFL